MDLSLCNNSYNRRGNIFEGRIWDALDWREGGIEWCKVDPANSAAASSTLSLLNFIAWNIALTASLEAYSHLRQPDEILMPEFPDHCVPQQAQQPWMLLELHLPSCPHLHLQSRIYTPHLSSWLCLLFGRSAAVWENQFQRLTTGSPGSTRPGNTRGNQIAKDPART